MTLKLQLDDSVLKQAKLANAHQDLDEFDHLSNPPHGDSAGWRFDRAELHERL